MISLPWISLLHASGSALTAAPPTASSRIRRMADCTPYSFTPQGTAVVFHKRRLPCKECHATFYENPYWVHPSLRMTQALYDSILLDLTEPISLTEIARHNGVSPSTVQAVFEAVQIGLPKALPKAICPVVSQQISLWYLRRRRPR